MARGASSPTDPLPKVSFVKVQDDSSTQPSIVHDAVSKLYGYNDSCTFIRPEDHYVRYIEPLETDISRQVEYDMDEQDQEWVDAINAERKAQGLDRITYEAFEIIMDRLEKEWFELTKNIPKPDLAMPSEDSTCNICDDSEGENTNAIVFCDGCNLAVHQDCYGVPYIPEGQWLCRKCLVSPDHPVSCILCPNEGGAFKQTSHGHWVHLLCAIWVPETRVANEVFMEPVTGVERISKQRWKLRCNICGIREGACIQCSKTSCFLAFHATCARAERLLMPMKAATGAEPPTLQCFCEKHLPKEQAEARETALAAERAQGGTPSTSSDESESLPRSPMRPRRHRPMTAAVTATAKSARAYAKTYTPGPPLVPAVTLQRVLTYVERLPIRKREQFVELCCRYWSLKREARRGAPLLKRLHLEPWIAAGAQARAQTEADKVAKLELMRKLRKELEDVRMLAEVCRKREKEKVRQAEVVRDVVNAAIFPSESGLRVVFEKIRALDLKGHFTHPVSKIEVPDYFDIIKQPMCWEAIDVKLDQHEYWDTQAFKDDVLLVVDNAMVYNKPGTPYYKTAAKIKTALGTYFPQLDSLKTMAPSEMTSSFASKMPSEPGATPSGPGYDVMDVDALPVDVPRTTIGDLEPPLSHLDLLTTDVIQEELDLLLHDKPPLLSLFAYEFGELKPPPTPPPPLPPKVKKDRKPARRTALDTAPGFRAPRTRRAAALEAEAPAEPEEPAPVAAENSGADKDKQRRKSKRQPIVLPGQGAARVVDSVDNHQSFAMFDQGWVLPEGSKRRGREGRAPLPLPPPTKKRKTGSKSQASTTAGSPGSERRALPEPEVQPHPDAAMETLPEVEGETEAGPSAATTDEAASAAREQSAFAAEALMALANSSSEPPPRPPARAAAKPTTSPPSAPQVAELTPPPPPPTLEPQSEEPMDVGVAPAVSLPPLITATSSLTSASESAEAAAAVESQLVPELAKPEKAETDKADTEPVETKEAAPSPAPAPVVLEPGERLVRQPDGEVIIEEEDTPQARRAKYMRKKAQRLSLTAGSSSAPPSQPAGPASATPVLVAGPSVDGTQSELSDLSALESEDEQAPVARKAPAKKGRAKAKAKARGRAKAEAPAPVMKDGKIVLGPRETLPHGTLVWGKAVSFPWYPAVVYDPDDVEVPPNVLQARDEHQAKSKSGMVHPVRFYDRLKHWQWLAPDKMKLLGEDPELDYELQHGSKQQLLKNSRQAKDIQASYQLALAEMDDEAGTPAMVDVAVDASTPPSLRPSISS